MKILILTLTYPPEPAEHIHDLASYLVSRSHDVTVLTSLPSYPFGRIYDKYRGKLYSNEVINGVKIFRLPIFPSHTQSIVKRAMFYISNALSIILFLLIRGTKPDVTVAYHPPLTIALPAIFLKKFRKVPYVYWIHDMWPETIEAQTGVNRLTTMIGGFAKNVYHKASRIVVLSEGFKDNLIDKGIDGVKITVVQNWADSDFHTPVKVVEEDYRRYGLSPSDFHVFYAGNLGMMQSLEDVILAGSYLRHLDDVKIVLMGTGARYNELEALTRKMGLEDKVLFLGRVPQDEVNLCYALATVFIVHIKDIPLNRITIPHKIYGYMLSAKPVIAAIRGDARVEVLSSGGGIACQPQQPESIAEAIEKLYRMPRSDLATMGAQGREFVSNRRSAEALAPIFEEVLFKVVG